MSLSLCVYVLCVEMKQKWHSFFHQIANLLREIENEYHSNYVVRCYFSLFIEEVPLLFRCNLKSNLYKIIKNWKKKKKIKQWEIIREKKESGKGGTNKKINWKTSALKHTITEMLENGTDLNALRFVYKWFLLLCIWKLKCMEGGELGLFLGYFFSSVFLVKPYTYFKYCFWCNFNLILKKKKN